MRNEGAGGRRNQGRRSVSELRIDYGPGYRVYFVRRGEAVIVLLAGGNKRTQTRDIEAALRLARFL
jgi:putative addiction module killer protein